MIKYYCDRCGVEMKKDQFKATPDICQYREALGFEYVMIQSDCKLCVDCMRKYISFLKGSDKDVK